MQWRTWLSVDARSEFGEVQGPRRVRVPEGKAKAREGERERGFVTV